MNYNVYLKTVQSEIKEKEKNDEMKKKEKKRYKTKKLHLLQSSLL